MRIIPISKGYETIVDDEDYEWLSQYAWMALVKYRKSGRIYVMARRLAPRRGGRLRKTLLMHREIMRAAEGQQIDHRNRNPLDNRRENLRFCTAAQNNVNQDVAGASGYRGVRKTATAGKWRADIAVNGQKICLGGAFCTPEAAAAAYNVAAIQHYGEFAFLNDVVNGPRHG
jgi:hypothetical protein